MIKLSKWVQDAVEKGQYLSVCLELREHAMAVDKDERAAQGEEKKQEIRLQHMTAEKDAKKESETEP